MPKDKKHRQESDDDFIDDLVNSYDDDICKTCDGTGTQYGHLCKVCRGSGYAFHG